MKKFLLYSLGTLSVLALIGAAGAVGLLWHFGKGLPDYAQLADYEPPTVTRVHAGDGRLLAEYAIEKRVFMPISAMPKRVINAFLAAEDKNFYHHVGVDPVSIVRAAVTNIGKLSQNRRPTGASTITQQVAKNFLLTSEVSLQRKAKEAILAFRIERAFSKDRILELYLNEIYLGFGSYGVAAAGLNYFDRALDDLSIAEAAYLAALPKAPNNYHPTRAPEQARIRRDYVIGRMLEDGHISETDARAAFAEPLTIRQRAETDYARADHFAEEVRRELLARYGEKGLYKGGLSVRTTVDPRLQDIADRALREGLIAYDRRHGWRGPVERVALGADWRRRLNAVAMPVGASPWLLAIAFEVGAQDVTIGFANGSGGKVPLAELAWAREPREEQRIGPPITRPSQVFAPGDVVLVEPVFKAADGKPYPAGTYGLRQVPAVSGAVVALDPHTGRVFAMSGGFSFESSQFNRATQAMRQPGSAFKPFVYMAGLDNGMTPFTLILDAPIVLEQGPGLPKWRPGNYGNKFYGPSTLRLGIEKSRNLMTVRLALTVGMDKVAQQAEAFGIYDKLPLHISNSLGAGETSVLKLTTAYAMLVNGGKAITPTLIDRVQDRHGRTVFKHDRRACDGCVSESWAGEAAPRLPDNRRQVANPSSVFQMVNMLQGVVERGTGASIRSLGRPLGGKTGTTNDSNDGWFVGFAPDLAVGVFVGFDTPKSLGRQESGASVAVPIFKSFMAEALAGQPAIPFRVPGGVRLVRVEPDSGRVARAGDRGIIMEAFKPGTEPVGHAAVIDAGLAAGQTIAVDESEEQAAPGIGLGPAVQPGAPRPAAQQPVATGVGGLY
ncbi:MAG: penicillin-binding protein 1A [Alphaproteobacteria bacterium]|nr:penicillin-binding protein 1A [Alphaproteobacteria bacterium]